MLSVKPHRQSLTTTGPTWTGCLSHCAMRRREGTARQVVVAGEGGEVVGDGAVEGEGGEVVVGGAVEGGEVVGGGVVGGEEEEEGAGVEVGEEEAEGGEEVSIEVRVDVNCVYIFLVRPSLQLTPSSSPRRSVSRQGEDIRDYPRVPGIQNDL